MVSIQLRPPLLVRRSPFGIPAQTTSGRDGSAASAWTLRLFIGFSSRCVHVAPPSADRYAPSLLVPAHRPGGIAESNARDSTYIFAISGAGAAAHVFPESALL